MRRIINTMVVAVGFLATGWSQSAQAQLSYEWNRDTQPVTGSIQVDEGSTVALRVYLREQTGGTTLQNQRLSSFGVRARYDNPTGVVSVPDTNAISRNPAFTDFYLPAVNNPTSAQFTAAVAIQDPGVSPDTDNRIWLGTFTFTVASGIGATQTTIRAIDIPQSDDTFTGTGTQLDSLIADAPLVIEVVPVPEPMTILLAGSVALTALQTARRLRRRRIDSVN
jgi:hypothetical protein